MFKDTEKELRRLEQELLAEEEGEPLTQEQEAALVEARISEDFLAEEDLDSLLEDTHIFGNVSMYQNHANGYGETVQTPSAVYNSDRLDENPDDLSRELLKEPKETGVTGLVITACLLTVGILCVAAWWAVRYWGLF